MGLNGLLRLILQKLLICGLMAAKMIKYSRSKRDWNVETKVEKA